LGLFVTYFITENQNGTLEVESEMGCWTRFHIRLPVVNS
jgi:signal transduction histidine kinase